MLKNDRDRNQILHSEVLDQSVGAGEQNAHLPLESRSCFLVLRCYHSALGERRRSVDNPWVVCQVL